MLYLGVRKVTFLNLQCLWKAGPDKGCMFVPPSTFGNLFFGSETQEDLLSVGMILVTIEKKNKKDKICKLPP